MAVSEKMQFILTANADGFIKAMQKSGNAADKELGKAESKLDKIGGHLTKFGTGALAAAGVVGGALFAASKSFENLAIESGKFADATGFTVEQSSRLIEVLDDIGIDSGAAEKSLGFMNKTLGNSPALFSSLGVEVAKAKDGTIDANATFLAVVDHLNGIKDPAQKAAEGVQLLGRGWQTMAELIAGGSGTLSASLAAVADAKVIDQGELDKAKELRAAFDTAKDSIENLALSIGASAAPVITALAKGIGGAVSAIGDLNAVTHGAAGGILALGTGALAFAGALSFVIGKTITMRENLSKIGPAGVSAFAAVTVVAAGLALRAQEVAKSNQLMVDSFTNLSRVADDDLWANFVVSLGQAAIAGEGSRDAIDKLAQSNLEAAKRVRDHGLALEEAGTATAGQREATDLLTAAIIEEDRARATAVQTQKDYVDAAEDGVKATEASGEAAIKSATAFNGLSKEQNDELPILHNVTSAFKDQLEALSDLLRKQLDAIGASNDLEKAQLDLADAAAGLAAKTAEVEEIMKDSKKTDEEKAQALRDLRQAQIDSGDSALDAAGKFAELNNRGGDLVNGAALQRDALIKMKEQYPLLGDEIQKYIDKLNAIPGVITTQAILYTPGGDAKNSTGRRAGGGPVSAGMPYTVGEHGSETFVPGRNGTILPHGVGGGPVNITINAPTGNAADIERAVVTALKQYQQRGGRA